MIEEKQDSLCLMLIHLYKICTQQMMEIQRYSILKMQQLHFHHLHMNRNNTICGDDMTKDEWYNQLFERLDNSKFRSSFHLKQKDIDYINEKGLDTIRQHAKDFIAKREAPAYIVNDGKQTPMRGHPVFIAQHATATCCRECIRKWHKMQPGKELSQVQQEYLVDVIMTWIQKEMERN